MGDGGKIIQGTLAPTTTTTSYTELPFYDYSYTYVGAVVALVVIVAILFMRRRGGKGAAKEPKREEKKEKKRRLHIGKTDTDD